MHWITQTFRQIVTQVKNSPVKDQLNWVIKDPVTNLPVRFVDHLRENNGHGVKIVDINCLNGTFEQMQTTLEKMSKTSDAHAKFPVVAIVEPYPIARTSSEYDTVTFTILIANASGPTWTENEREVKNFQPILMPIYSRLMRYISRCGSFCTLGPEDMPHQLIKHIEKVQWSNTVDVLEIRDLQLKINSLHYSTTN